MIVSRFLLWARRAPPGDRAEAVGALAGAYLHSGLSPDDLWQARTALTAMLDDPSAIVRCAMAEALADAAETPRHIAVALAGDQPDIAEIVLARSPVLTDGDLVDFAALGEERVQSAIARRPVVSSAVAAALAEVAALPALVALAANEGADLAEFSLHRMLERHGAEGELREAILSRPDLPVGIAQAVAAALAETLGSFVARCGWLSAERTRRVVTDARERTAVTLSCRAEADAPERLAAHLRRSGELTPALILRAILSGARAFSVAAFAELSGLPVRRVAAILADGRSSSFRSLAARAGLPDGLQPAFEAALEGFREPARAGLAGEGARLSRRMIQRALAACRAMPDGEAGRLVALLHRFEVEAARDEARVVADELADQAALALVLAHAPEELEIDPGTRLVRLAA